MQASFSARFVHTGYHLENTESEQSLESLLVATMPRGAVISVTVKVETTGETRGFCQAEGRYGACNNVLSADGKCRVAEHNEVLEPQLAL